MKVLLLLFIMTVTLRSLELNETNLARCIVSLRIENRELAFKQAMLESGNLKSQLATKGNNLFGMRFNKRSFCSGTIYGYAKYRCWQLSVIEYAVWVKKRSLKCYAKDKNYLSKLKRIKIKDSIKKILRG